MDRQPQATIEDDYAVSPPVAPDDRCETCADLDHIIIDVDSTGTHFIIVNAGPIRSVAYGLGRRVKYSQAVSLRTLSQSQY